MFRGECYMTIKVNGLKTEYVECEITKEELLLKARTHLDNEDLYLLLKRSLYKEMELPMNAYRSGCSWFNDVEHYTSHNFITKNKIRDLNSEDLVLLKLLDTFKLFCIDKNQED